MSKYKPYNSIKKKITYVTEQTVAIDAHLENLKNSAEFQTTPATDFYKNAKLIYESDWVTAELEKIPEGISTTLGTLLPERGKFAFGIDLSITEEFLPYIKIELLTRTNADILLTGVFPFVSSGYKPLQFQLYDFNGTTPTFLVRTCPGGCQEPPQPIQGYSTTGCVAGFISYGWIFPIFDFPVPMGSDPTHVLPVGQQYVGFANRLIYSLCGVETTFYWEGGGVAEFQDLITIYGLEDAKELLDTYYDNIIYVEDTISKKALEVINTNQVVTSQFSKKVFKLAENSFRVDITGDLLSISPAVEETDYSEPLFPTYQPHSGDFEVKLNIYSINPNHYSERKQSING